MHRRPMFDYFVLTMTLKILFIIRHFLHFCHFTSHNDIFRKSFGIFRGGAKMTSLMKLRGLTSL